MVLRALVARASAFAVVACTLFIATSGHAQGQPAEPADRGSSDAPAADAPDGEGGAAAPAERKPVTPAAGYAYGDKAARSRGTGHARYRKSGPVVNTPGFEQLPDGGSRFFVQLSQTVPVEERKAPGSITYVLKGASPRVWNNTNALVTVHFDTPVTRARLVPHGKDLFFVMELRADVAPTWKMVEAGDKGATLTIDFPKGSFTGEGAGAAPGEEPAASSESKPARAKPQRKAARRSAPATKAPPPATKAPPARQP